MRGLTILLAEPIAARLRSALLLALAQAALGGAAQLFVDGSAVAILRAPVRGDDDAAQVAAGLPVLAELVDAALDAGVRIILCQSGLALVGADASAFDRRLDYGGIVGVMAKLGDGRLVAL